jgi:hypothetical protein
VIIGAELGWENHDLILTIAIEKRFKSFDVRTEPETILGGPIGWTPMVKKITNIKGFLYLHVRS